MRPIRLRRACVLAAALALVMLLPASALGHAERHASFPYGNGTVPRVLLSGPTLLVCKADSAGLFAALPIPVRERNERLHAQCMQDGFRHIQAAVDAVQRRDTRILVLPGVYQEQPSRRAAAAGCDDMQGGGNGDESGTPSILSYDEQRQCPHVQNLIGIFGDSDGDRECDLPQCGLQIEGTGSSPGDVIIDGGFKVLNGIRADRVDGVRFRNFTMQRFEFNALYILETDGFLIDEVVSRWNDEYAFLTFAVDHGLYRNCEGYGNGDSAVYPGSASDIHRDAGIEPVDRYAVTIRNCRGHHNALGYSGTAGNAVHVVKSQFDHNQTGIATDSLFPDHPGLPQDHAFFDRNRIYSNNRNYVDYVQNGQCDKPFMKRGYEHGTVCPVIPAPIGTGLLIAGGNYNKISNNRIYDNWRTGTYQFYVPAALRNEPEDEGDTSHFNRYRWNRLGFGPDGLWQPNGVDFSWDDQGEGNCWEGNIAKRGHPTNDAVLPLPDCEDPSQGAPANAAKTALIASCAAYDRREEDMRDPPGCGFFVPPPRPEDREPFAPELRRTTGGTPARVAAGASRRAFGRPTDAVVVAPAADASAALVAAPLAGQVDGPLLLTRRSRLPQASADEVRRLSAERAYVVGGVGARVLRQLDDAGVREVTSIKGRNRFATAAKVARLMGGTEVYVARAGAGSSASVGIAGLAASQERPVVLSRKGTSPRASRRALRAMEVVNATLYGDRRQLTNAVRRAVDRRATITDRIGRHRRYALSAASARLAVRGIADETRLWVANGTTTDGVAAAANVAHRDGALLLVDGNNLDQSGASRRYLRNNRRDLQVITVVGGNGRVSRTVRQQIRAATD